MYKQKLYMLMKSLEIQDIEELMEKPSPYLVSVGLRIAEAARIGAKSDVLSNRLCEVCGGWRRQEELTVCHSCGKMLK